MMKLQEVYDYNGKSAFKLDQKKVFGRNLTKLKKLLLTAGFISICAGFYYVGSNNVDHKMTK